jgi:signal transduction histidine kinase/CheY-like chemotaxis protein
MSARVEVEVVVRNRTTAGARVAVTATPLRTDDKALSGSVALLRDVTERRRLEKRLLQSEKLEVIGRLAGSVAHDFNNLLAVIQGYGDLVLEHVADDDPTREDLMQLLLAAQRANTLTKQLLALGRRTSVKPGSKPSTCDLNVVVAGAVKMLEPLLGDRIRVDMKLSATPLPVRAEAIHLEQIIFNLTLNARDSMPEGGTLLVETAVETVPKEGDRSDTLEGTVVVLAITDTGAGMDQEIQKRIFEPFFTTKEQGKGTGLGLSTVIRIVEENKGRVRVESEVGSGSRFTVLLPRAELPSESTERGRSVAPRPTSVTILIVDEDDAVRRVAARILGSRGFVVVEARRWDDARLIVETIPQTIDLLLADPYTAGHGSEFAEALVERHPRLRILHMSDRFEESGSAFAGRPPVGQLVKPFTQRTLIDAVELALS